MNGRKWWMIIAALWFILYGLLAGMNLQVSGVGIVMGFLAILAGLLLFLDR